MTSIETEPVQGDIRVWHIPQIPGPLFVVLVASVEDAQLICDVLADYDAFQFENNIKPDYCNANGVEIFMADEDEWIAIDDLDEEAT